MSAVPINIRREIDFSLVRYFSDPSRLSEPYWPRSFCDFVQFLLQKLLSVEHLDIKFVRIFSNTDCLEDTKAAIISVMSVLDSRSITVRIRHSVMKFLETLRLNFILSINQTIDLPLLRASETTGLTWPTDVQHFDDLFVALTDGTLRNDIKNYIWNIIHHDLPDLPVNLAYRGIMKADPNKPLPKPIVVKVPSSVHCRLLTQRLAEMSADLLRNGCCGYLPNEIVDVEEDALLNALLDETMS